MLAIWGFVDSDNVILGLLPLNTEDNVLHLILGLTGLAAGAATPKLAGPTARPSAGARLARASRELG